MRLFIAIQLSDEMKKVITTAMHDMKKAGIKGSYVPAQNLHLTLVFIGETNEAAKIRETLRSVKLKSFHLSLSGSGNFGNLIWIGLKGNQGLAAAVKTVRTALDQAGIAHDGKEFMPHITIIRQAEGDYRRVSIPKAEMMVRKISLMKSEQKEGKRIYTEIGSVTLE